MSNNLISNVQWLVPIENCTIELAEKSNLASIRLRCALSAVEYKKMGFNVSFSDGFGSDFPDVLLVGKIDNITDKTRLERWIGYIDKCKSNGKIIIIDYTDHHLASEGANRVFYKNVLEKATIVTCSSRKLSEHLQVAGIFNVKVICDPIEVTIKSPKIKHNRIARALWFGHSTNLPYLFDFLTKLNGCSSPLEIVALTNAYPLQDSLIAELEKLIPSHISVNFIQWSLENLEQCASICDFAIIPAGFNHDRKSGASSNRLLTSLALGLPTLADPLDSYTEFNQYFEILNVKNLESYTNNSLLHTYEKITEFTEIILGKFTKNSISQQWAHLLSSQNQAQPRNGEKMKNDLKINESDFENFMMNNFILDKVGIDIVHGCQLRCIGCPNSILKPKIQKMSPSNFGKMLDNLNVKHINLLRLFNFGEPLLHEDLPLLLMEISKRKMSISNIELSTNGQYHDFPVLEEAIKLNIINTINVSCDGDGTPEEYERLRPPSRWEKFITFVEKLSELKHKYDPKLRIMTRTICDDPISQKRWETLLHPLGYSVEFRDWVYMPQSSINMTGRPIQTKEGICSFLKDGTRLYVDYDGTIVPCCVHPMAAKLGNLLENKFSDILRSEQRNSILKFMKDNRSAMSICNECSF